jgi:hypothetical protein
VTFFSAASKVVARPRQKNTATEQASVERFM